MASGSSADERCEVARVFRAGEEGTKGAGDLRPSPAPPQRAASLAARRRIAHPERRGGGQEQDFLERSLPGAGRRGLRSHFRAAVQWDEPAETADRSEAPSSALQQTFPPAPPGAAQCNSRLLHE